MGAFVLTLMTWTGALHACPDLAGRYVCAYRDQRAAGRSPGEPLVITAERHEDGVFTYVYNGSRLITDGQVRALPDDSEMKQQRLRAWCAEDDTLRGELRARYYDAGNYAGELSLNFTYAREGSNVRQITEGQLTGAMGSMPLSSRVTCVPVL